MSTTPSEAENSKTGEAAEVEAKHADSHEFGDSHADHAEYEHEDPQGSLAARLLSWLVLLLVGGGVALWAAPKVAPRLPQWAEPAREFLLPGETLAQREAQALRGELDARFGEVGNRIAEIPTGTDAAAVREIVTGELAPLRERIDAIEATVQTEIASLRDQLAATDSADIESRLTQAETKVSGLAAEFQTLNETLRTEVIGKADISEDTFARLTQNASRIEGVQAELAALADRTGSLSQRIDEVEARAVRQIREAENEVASAEDEARRAAEEAARVEARNRFNERFAALSAAAVGGKPFAGELAALAELDGVSPPEGLAEAAGEGIASLAALDTALAPLAHQAIRASIRAEAGENTASRFGAFLKSQVATRSLEATEGADTDAVLSRIRAALVRDDLAGVLAEAETLDPAAKSVLEGWLADVERRRAVLAAVTELGASAS